MGLGSSPKWNWVPLQTKPITLPGDSNTTTSTNNNSNNNRKKKERSIKELLVNADMFWVPYKHHLTKSSQKAPKGNKYYYSHFTGKETEQNCHICFPRLAASGHKNQDSNPHLHAKSILFNS